MKATREITFPTKDAVEGGMDAWELLPEVTSEGFYGKKVRVTVEAIEPDQPGVRYIAEYPRERGREWDWIEIASFKVRSEAVEALRDAGLPVNDDGYLDLISEVPEEEDA